MTNVHVPDFCTISEVCRKLGFTYYTVSYWLNNGLVKYVPAGSKKLINMQDLNRFLNGIEHTGRTAEDNHSVPDEPRKKKEVGQTYETQAQEEEGERND